MDVESKLTRLRRQAMVTEQLSGRGIRSMAVLNAMGEVPRHRFVAPELQDSAYDDRPLPIGRGQTISQPYIVALMTEALRPSPAMRVLDVGTGSGYQAAVLARLVARVFGLEVVPELCEAARLRLMSLGFSNVTVRCADARLGWPEESPFDGIVVAAAPAEIPATLVDALAPGGRLVCPVGAYDQELVLVEKRDDGSTRQETLASVRFVPLV